MCSDYTNWCNPHVTPYGVARAVNEFVIANGYSVEGLALHSAGMNDLLIRKPKGSHCRPSTWRRIFNSSAAKRKKRTAGG